MSGKSMELFCAGGDLLPVFDGAEADGQLVYVRAGLLPDRAPQNYRSGRELPGLGMSATGDGVRDHAYLVADAQVGIRAERVPQMDGGVMFAFDQKHNPRSIVIQPGGLYQNSSVVAGRLSTISEVEDSLALYNAFAGRIRKTFKKVRSYWVGPEALAILQAGGRLTPSVRASRILDLKAP